MWLSVRGREEADRSGVPYNGFSAMFIFWRLGKSQGLSLTRVALATRLGRGFSAPTCASTVSSSECRKARDAGHDCSPLPVAASSKSASSTSCSDTPSYFPRDTGCSRPWSRQARCARRGGAGMPRQPDHPPLHPSLICRMRRRSLPIRVNRRVRGPSLASLIERGTRSAHGLPVKPRGCSGGACRCPVAPPWPR